MLKYGLKLWTNNLTLFDEAISRHEKGEYDFIELYYNAREKLDYPQLGKIKKIPIFIHSFHDDGFHEFNFKERELEIWSKIKELADFFGSHKIIVHAGKASNIKDFFTNLAKINDPRILIENMAGLDIYGDLTFGYDLEMLIKIKDDKNICFDFEKAIKSACYQGISYKKFIKQCLKDLQPSYCHISGGDKNTVIDEHRNLQEANFDLKWIKNELRELSRDRDLFLAFETPKNGKDLENDIKNINYFKNL